jgi:protein-L-isoaspartate(D-aspartate) O-methyltransferase
MSENRVHPGRLAHEGQSGGVADDRRRMVEQQVRDRGIEDPYVLHAMLEVSREEFVPEALREFAYDDSPLPIEAEQTISQPYIVALMIAAAEIRPGDRVLEIGAGSGYAAAVMSRIAGRVYAIERHESLTQCAAERLRRLQFDNVVLRSGDGTKGWPEVAPFDAIVVSAGGPENPCALKDQLAIGGRLIIPMGDTRENQRLIKLKRTAERKFEQEDLGGVAFVPLIGTHGW